MAQCQNFFDDKSPSICKSSSSGEHQQLSPSSTTVEGAAKGEDRSLELRLGPSLDASKPKHHEMVRPIPLYPSLDRQRSGNYCNAAGSPSLIRGQSDSFLGEKALFSKDSAFSTPPLVSRDQVWRSLQNSNAVIGSVPSKIRSDDSTSPLLCRSASMQIVTPSHEMREVVACPSIRRSCSNSIPAGLLSRQSSFGQEALVDESPDPVNCLAHQHQQDALELQKKKEVQAHRRLEARKRRRLILEKQQKKARQCNAPNIRQSASSVEKASLVGCYSLERKYSLECRPRSEITSALLSDGGNKMSTVHAMDTDMKMVPSVLQQGVDSLGVYHGWDDKRHGNVSGGDSTGIQGALSNVRQMIASCDLSCGKEDSSREHGGTNVEMSDVSKVLPSCCSETESTETKEKETYASERESSSQKSSTENHVCHSVSAAMVSPSSKPVLCLQASPGASSADSKVQMKSFQQRTAFFSPQASRANEGLHIPQAPCLKLDVMNEVISDFTIKKSVGVFTEGKWRIPDEDPNCLPLRRTTSNLNDAVPEQHCMTKKCETHASLSASQLKFAGRCVDHAASSLQKCEMQLHLSSKLNQLDKTLKKDADAERVGNTFSSHITAPFKVKEEPDPLFGEISECCAAGNTPWQAPLKLESEPIKRQISASFSELPWVTTTGTGPNGRTINGVMYITGGRSVRLVCRCHGKHMSPAEFVEHAGGTDLSNPLRNIVVNPFPVANHLSTRV